MVSASEKNNRPLKQEYEERLVSCQRQQTNCVVAFGTIRFFFPYVRSFHLYAYLSHARTLAAILLCECMQLCLYMYTNNRVDNN